MDAEYDTFSYDDDQNEEIYEPIMDTDLPLPPVPPRNPRFPPVPTRKQPPVPAPPPPQAPDENYEDLNIPSIRSLPRRNSPFRDPPQRLPPPVPDVSQRMPPPMPDILQRAPQPAPDAGPEMNYEDVNGYDDQGPEMNYEDLSGYDDQPELNYEDLNCNRDLPPPPPRPQILEPKQRTLPPVPDQPQRKSNWGPTIEVNSKKNAPDVNSSQLDNNILTSALKNLKKCDARHPVNSPKPRTETPVKIQLSSNKRPIANKPILPVKPKFTSAKSSSIHEKISALNMDSPDSRKSSLFSKPKLPTQKRPQRTDCILHLSYSNNQPHFYCSIQSETKPPVKVFPGNKFASKNNTLPPPAKVSPSNNFASKNNTLPPPAKVSPSNNFASRNNTLPPPVKLSPSSSSLTSKNSEDISDEDFDSGEEYADAADIKSLHYQSYYYELLSKEMESTIFHSNTQDGTFVIRKSRAKSDHPYTMLVFYKTRTYRLKIRFEYEEYAIGEKKHNEKKFPCVTKLVEYFKTEPLLLIDAGSVTLRLPPDNI